MHHNLFLMCHLCALTHITSNYWLYMDVLHIEWRLYYQRHSLCGLRMHEGSDRRTTTPDTYHGCSLIQHRVRTESPCTHHYLVHNYAWQQNSHSLWLYCKPTTALLPMVHRFYKNKVLCHDLRAAVVHNIYLHIAVSFQLQWMLWVHVH